LCFVRDKKVVSVFVRFRAPLRVIPYFIGDAGAEISVRQTAVHNGFIYAATIMAFERAAISSKI
jgi:hypothetical protein